MKKGKYQLVLRLNFEAMDDIEAKQKAREYLKNSGLSERTVQKLQRLNEGKPPQGVSL